MSSRDPVDMAGLRIAEALRARAGSAASPSRPVGEWRTPQHRPRERVLPMLLVVLLVAILLGAGLALLSLTASSLLPIIG